MIVPDPPPSSSSQMKFPFVSVVITPPFTKPAHTSLESLMFPPLNSIPFANVLVPVVPMTCNVPVAVRPATVVVPRSAEPWIESLEVGEVVPTPRKPFDPKYKKLSSFVFAGPINNVLVATSA